MSWQTTKDAIQVAITQAVNLPAGSKQVFWESRPPFGSVAITLYVLAQQQEGPDRVVRTMNGSTGNFDVEVSALVLFTVNVRCEHINGDSLVLCELARSGLVLPSIRAALSAAGVVVVGPADSPIPVFGVSIDQRDVSAYSFDAYFRHEVHRSDPVALSTIEHVKFRGTANGNAVAETTIDRA